MAKNNQTVSEAQLKGRRTSLAKKSVDELITIILRKDKSERNMNSKIQELTALLKEADELNEEKASRIDNFDKDMAGMYDIIKTKQEDIDNLMTDKHSLIAEKEKWFNKYTYVKHIAKLRRKVLIVEFLIIIVLGILVFI